MAWACTLGSAVSARERSAGRMPYRSRLASLQTATGFWTGVSARVLNAKAGWGFDSPEEEDEALVRVGVARHLSDGLARRLERVVARLAELRVRRHALHELQPLLLVGGQRAVLDQRRAGGLAGVAHHRERVLVLEA